MFEYVYFDFILFGFEGWVSLLQEYFDYICVKEDVLFLFVCLYSKIVEDIFFGLQYFYERNIVYRDLKLGNVFILNQQYCYYKNVDEI